MRHGQSSRPIWFSLIATAGLLLLIQGLTPGGIPQGEAAALEQRTTPTLIPTWTPAGSVASATNTPLVSSTPTTSPTSSTTSTVTLTRTATPSPTVTSTTPPSSTITNTVAPTSTVTNTTVPSNTPTRTATTTNSPVLSATPTTAISDCDRSIATAVAVPTVGFPPSPTPTNCPTFTPTITKTPTQTFTPSLTPTPSNTPTNTPNPTPDLVVSKSAAAVTDMGGGVGPTYSVTIINQGGNHTTAAFIGSDPIMVDHLPTGLKPGSITVSAGSFLNCPSVFVAGGDAQNPNPHWDVVCTDLDGLNGAFNGTNSETVTIPTTIDSPSFAACGAITNHAVVDPNNIQVEVSEANNSFDLATTADCGDLDRVAATVDVSTNGGDVQDLNVSGGWTSVAQYTWFNDGVQPLTITNWVVTATVLAGPNGTPNILAPNSHITGGTGWVCIPSATPATVVTFTCSGILAADDGTPGDNVAGADGIDQVTISFSATGLGLSSAIGAQVQWTVNTPTCTLTCTSSVASAGNSDGSNLQYSAHTDTLTAWDLTVSKSVVPTAFTSGPGNAIVNNAQAFDVLVSYLVTVTNVGNTTTPAFSNATNSHVFVDHLPVNSLLQSLSNPANFSNTALISQPAGANVVCHLVAAAADAFIPGPHASVECHSEIGIPAGQSIVVQINAYMRINTCGNLNNVVVANELGSAGAPGSGQPGEGDIFNDVFTLPMTFNCNDIDIAFTDNPGGEDLSVAGGTYTAIAQYSVFNDGNGPTGLGFGNGDLTNLSVTGHVSGTGINPVITARTAGGTASTVGLNGGVTSCNIFNITNSSFDWTCTFSLDADNNVAGDNIANGVGTDQVDITITAAGASPPVQAGDTITFTLTAISCTGVLGGPTTCANPTLGTPTNNADGSTVVGLQDPDTLTP